MSKIGKQQIKIPGQVKINFEDDFLVVKGPKGELSMNVFDSISLKLNDDNIVLSPKTITKKVKSLWGLTRSLINNMVIGVTDGFVKKLEINGVGYKVNIDDDLLILALGYSHDIIYPIPEGVSVKCTKNTIEVSGCDKQLVGQVCADIRSLRKPEPYKGKGIKYENEVIVRKEGKKK
jgi:large subunit ribosomal protein L6